MPFNEPFRAVCFVKQLDHLLADKYPQSRGEVEAVLKSIIANPRQGDWIPGFPVQQVRKLRIGLKKHHISKQDGLRLIWLFDEPNKWILFIAIYSKKECNNKLGIQTMIKANLSSIMSQINQNDLSK